MRIVLFASGSPASAAALRVLQQRHEIAAVVVPAQGRRRGGMRALIGRRAPSPLLTEAASADVPLIKTSSGNDERLVEQLTRLAPDVVCAATFPLKIGHSVLRTAAYGGINLHPSLLPRHRGPDPIFWTYFHDERETGVTVHVLTERVDAGDIMLQETMPIERGTPGLTLYLQLAEKGATLLARAVGQLPAGSSSGTPQSEELATHEPAPSRGNWRIDFGSWTSERLWHFLRGVGRSHGRLIRDCNDLLHPVGEGRDFTVAPHHQSPGTIRQHRGHIRIFTSDGWVDADRRSLAERITMLKERLFG